MFRFFISIMKRFVSLFLSFAAVFGFALMIGDSGWAFRNSGSVLYGVLFFVLAYGTDHIVKTSNRRLKIFAAVPAGILSLCHLLGSVLVKKETALWLVKDLHTASLGLLHFFAYGFILFIFIFYLYLFSQKGTDHQKDRTGKLSFFMIWIVFILVWLPWMLNQFPAVMTADSTDQIEMALDVEPLTDHHPVFYTWLIKAVLTVSSNLFPGADHANQTGVSIFITIQFLLMTAAFAVFASLVIKRSLPDLVKIGILLFLLFYPVHPLYSVTMWKDVPFAVVLFVLMLLLICEKEQHKTGYIIGIAVSGILLALLRHNGIYLLLISFPFIPIAFKSKQMPVFAAFLAAILVYFCWRMLLLPALQIPKGEPSEAFSIPLQQIVLSAKRHRSAAPEEQMEKLDSWFSVEEIEKRYTYQLSDPVKIVFDNERYMSDPGNFWKLWLELGAAYPQDYLDALLLHTFGYWYPETPHWVFVTGIDDDGLFGIHMDPKLDNSLTRSVSEWLTGAGYDDLPLFSLLFSPGFCFWVYVVLFFYSLYRKSPAVFFYIPLIALWLTALASPINCEFRYIYGLFICLPLICFAVFTEKSSEETAA